MGGRSDVTSTMVAVEMMHFHQRITKHMYLEFRPRVAFAAVACQLSIFSEKINFTVLSLLSLI